jgi:hypothetical protein
MAKDVTAEAEARRNTMARNSLFRICGTATAAIFLLASNVASPAQQQKSPKELITGNWSLMIADHVRGEGGNVPGFGPLPKGSARFGADGRYSFEVIPGAAGHAGVSSSGTYTVDDAGKTLTLKVEESSIPTLRGTTQTGTVKFVANDHLGWVTSTPLANSSEYTGTELIWARAK